jgi:hypothetical protein
MKLCELFILGNWHTFKLLNEINNPEKKNKKPKVIGKKIFQPMNIN